MQIRSNRSGGPSPAFEVDRTRRTALRVDLSVKRAYIASFTAIAYVLAHRSIVSHDWPIVRTLAAIASDASVLAVLFFLYAFLDYWLQPQSLAAKGHKTLHFALTLCIIALATGAQVLHQKTGETLNFGILVFFLTSFGDLTGASRSVIDQDVLLMLVACFGFYILSLIRMRSRLLRALHFMLFLSPLLSLGLDSTHERPNPDDITAPIAERALYRGKYANMAGTHQRWLAEKPISWREGILASLTADAIDGFGHFKALEEQVKPLRIYASPQKLSSPSRLPNILFIILESTRADMVGAHGRRQQTVANTPFIDSLAESGWSYERAYTTIPHTSKALVGIYCGTFAKFGGNRFESTNEHYPINCLPKLLAAQSYRTGHFQTAPGSFEDRSSFLTNAGFEHTVVQEDLNPDQNEKYGYLGLDDRLLVKPMLEWMRKQHRNNHPFFASMLTIMTHHPYFSPGNKEPLQTPVQAKKAYARAIHYTDDVVRELIEGMKRHGLLENTIVVITGDHGEGFGEHGQITHNGTAYEEGMRVPLIVHAPWLLQGAKRIQGLRQHIDIMPSLVELIGSTHDGLLPGKNLFNDPAGHDELITSCFYENYCLDHYMKDGTKLVYFFGKRPHELYNLEVDPMEQTNLSPQLDAAQVQLRVERLAKLKKSYSQIYSE